MKSLKLLFDFYIDSSIHVALSCFALTNCTFLILNIPTHDTVAWFAFFGTFVGYNFVKFDALARAQKNKMIWKLKAIAGLSCFALLFGIYYFLKFEMSTKIVAFLVLLLTVLYGLPFFPNKKNARNWAGFKIYIVAICWIAVTVLLPILNSGYQKLPELLIVSLQRLLLIFPLILIFEIVDLKNDGPYLKTVPQQIGVKNTKTLGSALLVLFCVVGLFNFNDNGNTQFIELLLNFAIAIVIGFFQFFSNENRSKYYTSFWVESIPICWWLLYLLIK